MTLLVATTNPGKLREVAGFLRTVPGLRLASLKDAGPLAEVEEDGATFLENAVKKAVVYARASGLLTLADDSGLCVDALGGEPGVLSARYGGAGLDDAGRCRHLLGRMASVPDGMRTARFACVLALARPSGLIASFSGIVEGSILRETRGTNGFGYDPLFYYPPFEATLAEVPLEKKGTVSHRGRALAAFSDWLAGHPGVLASESAD
jgi:XTP/dITP diphosphohydrolase